MAVDPKIEEAIKEAVREEGQSDSLAQQLVAWFKAIASGNEKINNRQSADMRLDLIYKEAVLSEDVTDDVVPSPDDLRDLGESD